MSLETLILYGSAARGDQNIDSDLDLFGISADQNYNMSIKERVNLAIYPFEEALRMAEDGNLFMLHLVSEGKPIYDSQDYFAILKENFRYKLSYEKDVADASDLGWALIKCSSIIENFTLLNKRIAWCVRTILIATTAEIRRPTFSAESLADFAGDRDTLFLIKNKSSDHFSGATLKRFKRFLQLFGRECPTWIHDLDMHEYIDEFEHKKNPVASQTIKRLLSDLDDFNY